MACGSTPRFSPLVWLLLAWPSLFSPPAVALVDAAVTAAGIALAVRIVLAVLPSAGTVVALLRLPPAGVALDFRADVFCSYTFDEDLVGLGVVIHECLSTGSFAGRLALPS